VKARVGTRKKKMVVSPEKHREGKKREKREKKH